MQGVFVRARELEDIVIRIVPSYTFKKSEKTSQSLFLARSCRSKTEKIYIHWWKLEEEQLTEVSKPVDDLVKSANKIKLGAGISSISEAKKGRLLKKGGSTTFTSTAPLVISSTSSSAPSASLQIVTHPLPSSPNSGGEESVSMHSVTFPAESCSSNILQCSAPLVTSSSTPSASLQVDRTDTLALHFPVSAEEEVVTMPSETAGSSWVQISDLGTRSVIPSTSISTISNDERAFNDIFQPFIFQVLNHFIDSYRMKEEMEQAARVFFMHALKSHTEMAKLINKEIVPLINAIGKDSIKLR